MKKAKYICIEGTEGVGKGLQTDTLVKYLENKGYKVLLTKEPGTPHLPITQELRGIMLNQKYEVAENVDLLLADLRKIMDSSELTETAVYFLNMATDSIHDEKRMTIKGREFVSQAIRSIHLEKLIAKQIYNYDFIIQDRGLLSGIAYGEACGNSLKDLKTLANRVVKGAKIQERDIFQKIMIKVNFMQEFSDLYDHIIYLNGNPKKGLETAKNAKQEFADGDAMELKGNTFMENVAKNFKKSAQMFNSFHIVEVHKEEIEEKISDSGLSEVKVINFRKKEDIFNDILRIIGE